MQRREPMMLLMAVALLTTAGMASAGPRPQIEWPVHSKERPHPPAVEPGGLNTAGPPSDAVVLFGGSDLSAWRVGKEKARGNAVRDGVIQMKGTGGLRSKKKFGDCQVHIEFATSPGDHGNSGVYLMGKYELQVYNSYQQRHKIYADGQAAAIYGQHPPRVNACRPAGQWQSYDIVFRRPRFEGNKLVEPARMTVFHNGVLVHDSVALTGPTAHKNRPPYKPHAKELPLTLQDHGDTVRYRNVWVRPLE